MFVAIDESGSASAGSTSTLFFVGALVRQRKTLLRVKERAFTKWEQGLPSRLKDHKGEIKGKALSDSHLAAFASEVLAAHPIVHLTATALVPAQNPQDVVAKHRHVQTVGIKYGADLYLSQGKTSLARTYEEFDGWFDKLSYDSYLKLVLLGRCISHSLVDAFGVAISRGWAEEELLRLRYLIDRDFIRSQRTRTFWQEVLRNQVLQSSERDPLPLLDTWRPDNPVVRRYMRDGHRDMGVVLRDALDFVGSHDHFQVRIADLAATIIARHSNRGLCDEAYSIARRCIARDTGIAYVRLTDFDLDSWVFRPEDNPWLDKNRFHIGA